jgi:protein TonB
MSSMPRKVLDPQKQCEDSPFQPPDLIHRERESIPPTGETDAQTDNVEALVGDFLRELDVLEAGLEHPREPEPPMVIAAVQVAGPPEIGAATTLRPCIEEEEVSEEAGGALVDVEAELARTLDELEMQDRSNVVTLPIHEVSSTRRAGIALVSDSESSSAAPAVQLPVPELKGAEEKRESPVSAAEPGLTPGRRQALITLFAAPEPPRMRWRVAVGFAAVILLIALMALVLYRFFPSSADMQGATKAGARTQGESQPSASVQKAEPAVSENTPDNSISADATATQSDKSRTTAAPNQSAPALRTGALSAAPAQASKADSGTTLAANSPAAGRTNSGPAQVPPRLVAPSGTSGQVISAKTEPTLAVTPLALIPPAATPGQQTPTSSTQQTNAGARTPTPLLTVRQPPDENAPPSTPPALPASQTATPAALQSNTAAAKAAPATAAPPVSVPPAPAATGSGASSRESTGPSKGVTPPAGLTSPAVAISRVAPQYPQIARKWKIAGTVMVVAQVDSQGRVSKATAVSGPDMLRQSAVDAVMQWRFKPAVLKGVNVSAEVSVSVVFQN